MTWTLSKVRDHVCWALIGLSFLHVPLVALALYLRGEDGLPATGVALGLAGFALLVRLLRGEAVVTRIVIAMVLVAQVSLLVFGLAGHPWQADMHMYYFAVLALLAGFCDWRPVVVGAGLTAIHHLVLQFLLPAAVFYQGGDIWRVLFHALIVVAETSFLAVFATAMARLFAMSEESLRQAQDTAERERAASGRERELADRIGQRAAELQDVVAGFRGRMEQAMHVFDRSARQMTEEADMLTATSEQARSVTAGVSHAASETMDGIDQLSAASVQLATSIAEIGRNAANSAGGSKSAAELARRASHEIDDLMRSSENVGSVVEIIRGIAAQTNLLALNATIEAARAGEMGRGFAVVASEVKTLSAETARATDDVSAQVGAMQQASTRSLKAIREIVDAIAGVEDLADAIAYSVHEQGRATSEIADQTRMSFEGARRSAEIASGFDTMTVRIHEAAGQLQQAASDLAAEAEGVRREVTSFCARVAVA